MKKMRHMTGLIRPDLKRLAAIFMLIGPGLIFSGCVVGNDEFDEAKRQRDQYLEESKAMVAGNDQLNKEIARLYNDCDFLASQLAMVSAVSLHNRLTADLGKPKPVAQPAPQTTRRETSVSGGGGSGRQTGGTGQRTGSGGGQRTGAGGQRTGSGGGGQQSGGGAGGTGGGSSTPAGGGAIDWGSLTN